MSIYQLVNEIDSGEIVLPAIQRDFVWDQERVVLLFDSLFRGYPVGIALLWETFQPIQFRSFSKNHVKGDLHTFKDNKPGSRIKLVLDGQQRLNSIYVALRGTYDGAELYFDVLSGRDTDDHSEVKYKFKFLKISAPQQINSVHSASSTGQDVRIDESRAYWVKLSDLVGRSPKDLQKIRKEIAIFLELDEDDKTRLELNLQTVSYALSENDELLKTQVVDHKLPANDERRKSAFDILEIFVRVNTQGMALRRSDLIVSMLRLYWPEASDLLPAFIKDTNLGNGITIDNDFVIRCMFSIAGIGTRLDFDLLRRKSNVEKIKSSYNTTFESIRSCIDFVRADCGIDSSRLLGGISTLVPFVHFLSLDKDRSFSKTAKSDARRALFLFAFSKVFGQHAESRTGSFIRDNLALENTNLFPIEEAIRYVYWKTNFSKADYHLFANNVELALSMVQKRSGGKIYLATNSPEIDHIFPQSALSEKGIDPLEIQDIGNLWILPRKFNRNKSASHPAEYLKDIEDTVLGNALIPRAQLDYRSFRSFIRARREAIAMQLIKLTGLSDERFSFLAEGD